MTLNDVDFIRDQLDNTSSCPKCGYREPVRIEAVGCNKCAEFPKCNVCRRWTGDGGFLPKAVAGICSVCIENYDGINKPVDEAIDRDPEFVFDLDTPRVVAFNGGGYD